MRRAEKDHRLEMLQPRVAPKRAVMTRTPGDEPTHAVANENELGKRCRPPAYQRFEQMGECTTVGGNMQARVVVKIDGRVSENVRQRRAVIVTLALPRQIVQAQAVHQHDELAACLRKGCGQSKPLARQWKATATDAHRDR